MIRLWSAIIVSVALAGIVHIVALQLVPLLTPRLARDRLAALGAELQFHPIRPDAAASDLDPAVRYAACLFDLTQGPVSVEAAPGGEYWGLSFHDRYGGVFYALNNRSAEQGRVTLVVAPEKQAPRLSRLLQERNDPSVVISAPVARGYAMLKILAQTPSRAAEAVERLGRARCRIFEPPPPPPAEASVPPEPPPQQQPAGQRRQNRRQ